MKTLRRAYLVHHEFILNPLFLGVLAAKLAAGACFSSYYNRDLFIPFVTYWVDSGFQNPWDEFLRRAVLNAFPYSSMMLLLLGLPSAVGALFFGRAADIPFPLQLLLMRIPLLLADAAIYLLLCRWFEAKWKYVLWIYWCSPVLFFISYVHGQIDVVPTAFLLLSVWYLLKLSPVPTGVLLGMGLATKFHVLLAAPLFAAYFYKNGEGARRRRRNTLFFTASLLTATAAFIVPWLSSPGYRRLVLQAKESAWIYDFAWAIGPDLKIYLAPAVTLILMLHFFSYRSHSRDLIILYLGLIYSTLILFVRPMPGWAFWSVPFLCYFLIREQLFGYFPFWAYTGSYLLYYLLFAEGVAVASLEGLSPASPVFDRLKNLAFTGMQASLALTTYWVYRMSVHPYGSTYARGRVAVGVGGDSGSGKHVLADILAGLLGPKNVVLLHGDDYHRWERGHPSYREFTHLNLNSNYFRLPAEHIAQLKKGLSILKPSYDHTEGRFTPAKRVDPNSFIFFIGLHPFIFDKMRALFDLKIFLDTEESLQEFWKTRRDQRERGYDAATVVKEIVRRSADAKKYVSPQKAQADWIIRYHAKVPDTSKSAWNPPELSVRHLVRSRFAMIENLVTELREAGDSSLKVHWTLDDGLAHQVLDASGTLSHDTVIRVARRLFPDAEGLLQNKTVEWTSGINGLSQLIFACLLHEMTQG